MTESENIEAIYRSHVQNLYNYAIYLGADKELAMDLIHDIFCKLCAEKKTIRRINNMESYLFRSLKNSLINASNSKESSHLELKVLQHKPICSEDAEDLYISIEEEREIKTKIDDMLATLTERQKEIIYLRYALEYDYAQIAEIMGITPGSCRKLTHKAITELRQKFPYNFLLILGLRIYLSL